MRLKEEIITMIKANDHLSKAVEDCFSASLIALHFGNKEQRDRLINIVSNINQICRELDAEIIEAVNSQLEAYKK